MKDLFTQEQRDILKRNGTAENFGLDHVPVVKLFTPNAACTWLLTDLSDLNEDGEEADTIAFGLCDLGMGFPELGYINLTEMIDLKEQMGVLVERDLDFKGAYPISVYAEASRAEQAISEDEKVLAWAAAKLKKQRIDQPV